MSTQRNHPGPADPIASLRGQLLWTAQPNALRSANSSWRCSWFWRWQSSRRCARRSPPRVRSQIHEHAVLEAVQSAQLDEFVLSFPKPASTPIVGENGVCISGGERQRGDRQSALQETKHPDIRRRHLGARHRHRNGSAQSDRKLQGWLHRDLCCSSTEHGHIVPTTTSAQPRLRPRPSRRAGRSSWPRERHPTR